MSTIRFHAILKANVEPNGLGPAPSVSDWEHINEGLKGVEKVNNVDDLLHGTTHEIRGSYRGWNMYLYPNVNFTRSANGRGVNGYAGAPMKGDQEKVLLRVDQDAYEAYIEYV
jgi:hypothetical protein